MGVIVRTRNFPVFPAGCKDRQPDELGAFCPQGTVMLLGASRKPTAGLVGIHGPPGPAGPHIVGPTTIFPGDSGTPLPFPDGKASWHFRERENNAEKFVCFAAPLMMPGEVARLARLQASKEGAARPPGARSKIGYV